MSLGKHTGNRNVTLEKHNDKISEKLRIVLNKILDESYTFSDDSILNKLHSHLSDYVKTGKFQNWINDVLLPWQQEVVKGWNNLKKNIKLFSLQVAAVIASSEDGGGVQKLIEMNILQDITGLVPISNATDMSFVLVYTEMMLEVVKHEFGSHWFLQSDVFRPIVKLYCSNDSLYVHMKLKDLLVNAILVLRKTNMTGCQLLLDNILEQGCVAKKENSNLEYKSLPELINSLEKDKTLTAQKLDSTLLISIVGLLSGVIESMVYFPNELGSIFDQYNLELWSWTNLIRENSNKEVIRSLSTLITLLIYSKPRETVEKTHREKEILVNVCCLLQTITKKEQFLLINNILKQCNMLSIRRHLSSSNDSKLFALCMVPFLEFVKLTRSDPDESILLNLIGSTDDVREYLELVHGLGEEQLGSFIRSTVQALRQALDYTVDDHVALVYKILLHMLRVFLIHYKKDEANGTCCDRINENSTILCTIISKHPNFLIDVLDALEIIITNYEILNIDVVAGSEILTVLDSTFQLSVLTAHFKIKILRLIRSIVSLVYPSPDACQNEAFVLDCFVPLGPLLMKNLANPHWEIRDSILEILQQMCSQSEARYPSIQEFLVNSNFPPVVYDIAICDEAVYVRASAIVCLQKMVRVNKLRKESLENNWKDIIEKMLLCLQEDTEGIVRKEAVCLITEIYKTHEVKGTPLQEAVYNQIQASATSDLHWEVKVKAISFWDMVIDNECAEIGMVDGDFPVDSSTEKGGAIKTEIESKLSGLIDTLSKYGCLLVLWSTLNDSCDLEVVRKSAAIISKLLNILNRYGLVEKMCKTESKIVQLVDDHKRSDVVSNENRESVKETKVVEPGSEIKYSDDVIQSIVNSKDVELLSSVAASFICRRSESKNVNRKTVLECGQNVKGVVKLTAQDFITKISVINLEDFVNSKDDWIVSADKLESLMDDILVVSVNSENQQINAIDCY